MNDDSVNGGERDPRALRARALAAIARGVEHLARAQTERGSWWGPYGGPMFLLPMYVAACRCAGREISVEDRGRIARSIEAAQRPDGSVGLHVEGDGSMFTTALNYAALRLVGVAPEHPAASRMRDWIRARGGPLGAASWGKFTLALLGLYPWDGLAPILPELWLLPYATPFHPGRLWCHCRQVYLPMAYLYGRRVTAPEDALTRALRAELYPTPYDAIDFSSHVGTVAPEDAYRPDSPVLRAAQRAMRWFERAGVTSLRARALRAVYEHIRYEDDVTHDIKIGPVNAVLDTLCHAVEGDLDRARRGFEVLERDYLWREGDALTMQGYNSTELWDTAFAAQAILASPFASAHEQTLSRAHAFVRDHQIVEDVPERERFFRGPSRGGWPFSNRAHGWPITDCTAEGLRVALAREGAEETPIPEELLRESVRRMLGWQNDDGGWASYERRRAGAWMEHLNPSQVFGDIMVDYSYVECTSAVLQALALARVRFAGVFDREIDRAMARGAAFVRSQQRPDGSFEGSWAVCFTYGTWFGVSGLLAAGASERDPAIVRACAFLRAKQRADGAWGEHPSSSAARRWIEHADGHAANTSWALSTLVRAHDPDRDAQARAARWLLARQGDDGAWPRESLVGVFNRTCLIDYDNYRRYFPVWALSEWVRVAS